MPQFDIFSFFSQIFWVFFGFTFFYLLSTFFLLPALGTILKIRRRKLSLAGNNSSSNNIVLTNTNTIYNVSNTSIISFGSKLTDFNATVNLNNNFVTTLIKTSIKFDTLNKLKGEALNSAQRIVFLYK